VPNGFQPELKVIFYLVVILGRTHHNKYLSPPSYQLPQFIYIKVLGVC